MKLSCAARTEQRERVKSKEAAAAVLCAPRRCDAVENRLQRTVGHTRYTVIDVLAVVCQKAYTLGFGFNLFCACMRAQRIECTVRTIARGLQTLYGQCSALFLSCTHLARLEFRFVTDLAIVAMGISLKSFLSVLYSLFCLSVSLSLSVVTCAPQLLFDQPIQRLECDFSRWIWFNCRRLLSLAEILYPPLYMYV